MIRPVNNKKYTNAHPVFERITGEKVEPERIELASGTSWRDLKSLPGTGLVNKLEYDGKNVFVITPKGRQYLEQYKKFADVAGSFGLEM